MVSQSHICQPHPLVCIGCVADFRQIFKRDQQAAEDEHFVVFVQAEDREVDRYTATESLWEALEILEDLKKVYPLVFVVRGLEAFALARDGEVKAV